MTTEEFAKSLKLLAGTGYKPTDAQINFLPATCQQSRHAGSGLARRLKTFDRFLQSIGAAVLALPQTAPQFAREFWHELRTGQEPAWMALGWGFVAACALGTIGLLASAASH
jgi:hypothetical protein